MDRRMRIFLYGAIVGLFVFWLFFQMMSSMYGPGGSAVQPETGIQEFN